MAMYSFRCVVCGADYDSTRIALHRERPCICGGRMRKIFTVNIGGRRNGQSAFQPHYNHAVGSWVESDREFKAKLRDAGSRATDRTGIPTDYTPTYPGDVKDPPANVDHYAIETGNRAWHDKKVVDLR